VTDHSRVFKERLGAKGHPDLRHTQADAKAVEDHLALGPRILQEIDMEPTFLLKFQEPVEPEPISMPARARTGTGTKTREEPDQDISVLGTQTRTLTREEIDQDRANLSYFAIPR